MELNERKAASVKWRQLVSQRASESGKKTGRRTRRPSSLGSGSSQIYILYFDAVLKSKSMLEKICDSFAVGHPEMRSRKQVDRS